MSQHLHSKVGGKWYIRWWFTEPCGTRPIGQYALITVVCRPIQGRTIVPAHLNAIVQIPPADVGCAILEPCHVTGSKKRRVDKADSLLPRVARVGFTDKDLHVLSVCAAVVTDF